jgi:hypothetical protein
MRQTISGLVAAIAVLTVSAVPALACGGLFQSGLFQGGCSPCGQAYVEPCAQQVYVPPAPVYSGCNTGCGSSYERLPDPELEYSTAEPVHQYYYANQGPTYSGPGNFAPYPAYEEGGYSAYRHHRHHYGYGPTHGYGYGYAHHGYGYGYGHHGYGYGYAHHGYAPHFYGSPRHSMRYGAPMGMPRAYGHREMHEHGMRRYN